MRRRLLFSLSLVVFLIGAILGVGYVVLWLTIPDDPVTFRHVRDLRHGMHESEIIRIIGVKPGDYSTGPARPYHPFMREAVEKYLSALGPNDLVWHGDRGTIFVRFDDDRKATLPIFIGKEYDEGLLETIRLLIGM